MDVHQALEARKSTRAFLERAVEREVIVRILDAARHAPSGTNMQPWQVAVVTGAKKRELEQALETVFLRGDAANPDYRYYPQHWAEPFKSRRKACGLQLYSALEIGKGERERQIDQWAANFRAFGAPVMLLFFMDGSLETGSFIDLGMFVQSVMLAATEEGLATCPQASLADYPQVIKRILGYPDETIMVCGMALGYEDRDAPVNGYRTPREEVDAFTRFFWE